MNMTQEEKQILLKDLCARLPHGVICYRLGRPKMLLSVSPYKVYCLEFDNGEYMPGEYKVEDIKPYLRPMTSMTEEEFQELHSICPHLTFNKTNVPGWIIGINGSEYGRISRIDEISKLIDWLNSHHFDYRGLISMGLALKAPENMYTQK